jgi:dTDP-4-amino-4,6-dideoxygalactose transaminase
MPVHIAGHPCPRDEIYQLAEEFQLAVVEDAAHAFPASSRGRPVGKTCNNAVRSAACFSFYATKTITTGEGGMLVTDDDDLIDRARIMSLHGLSKDAWARYSSSGSWRYDIIAPGFKYNMTDMAAALGRVQLRRAYEMRSRRSEIAEKYNAAFSSVDALTIPSVLSDTETAWHLYQLRIPKGRRAAHNREDFISSLNNSGIGTSVHFIPLHLQPYYQNTFGYAPSDFPVSTAEFEREISLPIYSSMTDHEVERVIEAVLIAASRF